MKIAYVIQYFGSPTNSYASGRSWDFALHWASKGHNVWVICSDAYFLNKQRRTDFDTIPNLEVTVLNQPYYNKYSILLRLWAFISFTGKALLLLLKNPFKYDFLYASSTPLTIGFVGLFQEWITKKPWFFEIRDLWPDFPIQAIPIKKIWLKTFLYTVERLFYQNATKIVCLSPVAQQILVREKRVNFEKILLIPNGYSQSTIGKNQEQLKSNKKPFFLYEGALGRANGVDWLIQFFNQILNLSAIAEIYIAGFGVCESTIQRWIGRLPDQLKTRVHFLGTISRSNAQEIVKNVTYSLVTFSEWSVLQSNSPNKLFDAMAQNVKVITNTEGWISQLAFECGGFFHKDPLIAATLALKNFPLNQKNDSTLNYKFNRSYLADKLLIHIEKCG